MIMIASDGNPFEPFTADSFNIFAGERYDFILYADKTDTLRYTELCSSVDLIRKKSLIM